MKNFLIPLFSVLSLTSCVKENQEQIDYSPEQLATKSATSDVYYWSGNEKVYRSIVPDTYFAIFDATVLKDTAPSSISNISDISFKNYSLSSNTASYNFRNNSNDLLWAKVGEEILSAYSNSVVYSAPYIHNSNNDIGISNIFYIQLHQSSDYNLLKEFVDTNNAIIISEEFVPLWYTIMCTSESNGNALQLSNLAYESGKFASTCIEFTDNIQIDEEELLYNDTYYASQWNLHDLYGIDIENVHSITTGDSDIVVAVIDNGIQTNHPDLNITSSWDSMYESAPGRLYYGYGNTEPDYHGTAMTGIIGAIPNNNLFIAGIAPDISLLPISANFNVNNINEQLAKAIRYAADHNVNITSNSWGATESSDLINQQVSYALNKGCVIIHSSGNYNSTQPRYPAADFPDIITTGNIQRNGTRYVNSSNTAYGSSYGTNLDIVAPGTDITTLNATSSYHISTGTSPAVPHVSSTVALMLSVNPNLSRSKITEILNRTARKLPTYTFATTSDKPHGTWNNEVGYGLVNSIDAISLAMGYYNLISFDYTGQSIELSLAADIGKELTIIWDWKNNEKTDFTATSSTPQTITHSFANTSTKRIFIAERVNPNNSIPSSSTALIEFEIITGNNACDIQISPRNTALEFIRIIGGSGFASQTISIKDLPALEALYLVQMADADIIIQDCPALTSFGSSRYIWNPNIPSIGFTIEEDDEIMSHDETLNPDVIGDGGSIIINPNTWPTIPESVISFSTLDISNCSALKNISFENIGLKTFDFSDFPNLNYVYISSTESNMVVGMTNPLVIANRGATLASTVSTLPTKPASSYGYMVIRCVNSAHTQYTTTKLSPTYYNNITNTASVTGIN